MSADFNSGRNPNIGFPLQIDPFVAFVLSRNSQCFSVCYSTANSRWASNYFDPETLNSIRQHRLFRIATIYAVAGWLLIQFADISLEAFESPPWIMQTILVVVLAGFPVTLTAVWLYERSQAGSASNTLVSVITIGLAGLISFGAYQYFEWDAPNAEETTSNSVGNRDVNPVLAVLPFANMSSDTENEYLADGITEDVITLLAQSPGMEVIARNSTFKYKNQNPDIRDVGRDLGADFVVEGSIRPLGERIRVTVQVIETESGAHIWAEKYDRPVSDFFAVQDEVSLGVAAAVGDAVFRARYKEANQSRTANLDAWALTYQANVNFSLNPANEIWVAKARKAVELDPEYALAHAVLGRALAIQALVDPEHAVAEEALAAAQLAAKLAPDDPRVLAYLAITLLWTGNPVDALATAERVPKLSPGYAEGLAYYGDILTHNGRSEESIPYFDKAILLTPNAPQLGFYQLLRGEGLMHHGNFAEANGSLIEANRLSKNTVQTWLRYLAGSQLRIGNVEEAKNSLRLASELEQRSIDDERRMMAYYSTDGGGEHFGAIWDDLEALAQMPPSP
jgi:TolB-like protein/Flp pilus assembly protein TadD